MTSFPSPLHAIAIASLALGVASAITITLDEFRRPQAMWIMNLVWPLCALFGSLLWQRRTSLSYLGAASDLDLLWPVGDAGPAWRLARGLAAAQETLGPVRMDGEILLPDGGGVQWRELSRARREVLVKTLDGVELRPIDDLLAATPLPG